MYYTGVWQWQSNSDYLAHHGILGQKWGKRNVPPYPLSAGAHSSAEKRLKSKNEGKLESWKAKERAKGSRDANRDFNTVRAYLPGSRMNIPSDRDAWAYTKRHSNVVNSVASRRIANKGGIKVSTEYAKAYEEKRQKLLNEAEYYGFRQKDLDILDKKTKALLNVAYSEPKKLDLKKISSNVGKALKQKISSVKATLDKHPKVKKALKIAAIIAIASIVTYAAGNAASGLIRKKALEVLDKRMNSLMDRPFVSIGNGQEYYSKKIAELISGEISVTRHLIDTVKFGSTIDKILGSLTTLNNARHW